MSITFLLENHFCIFYAILIINKISADMMLQFPWSYLEWTASRKQVGAQNEKIPNMDIQQTLYNSHSHKGFFFTKRFFPIVNVFTTLFNWSHQEADFCKKQFIFACLQLITFHFKYCLYVQNKTEELWWHPHLVWTHVLRYNYVLCSYAVLLPSLPLAWFPGVLPLGPIRGFRLPMKYSSKCTLLCQLNSCFVPRYCP